MSTFAGIANSPEFFLISEVDGIMGKLIRRLHPESLELIWDGKSRQGHPVKDGVYLLQVKTNQYARHFKFVISSS